MDSSNPAMIPLRKPERAAYGTETMTFQGTAIKTAVLLVLALISAGYVWSIFYKTGNPAAVTPWVWGGLFGGLVVAIVTSFKPQWAAFTAPAYALLEGLFIGGVSSIMEASFPGIVIQACSLTFGVMAMMLAFYVFKIIEVTDKLRTGVFAATGAIALFYLASIGLSFFGIQMPLIHSNGLFGILFSIFVVGLAAFNLLIDFDLIDRATKQGAPKAMEWYGAFALMVTLVWLYIEVLRLLSKLRDR